MGPNFYWFINNPSGRDGDQQLHCSQEKGWFKTTQVLVKFYQYTHKVVVKTLPSNIINN